MWVGFFFSPLGKRRSFGVPKVVAECGVLTHEDGPEGVHPFLARNQGSFPALGGAKGTCRGCFCWWISGFFKSKNLLGMMAKTSWE